MRIGIVGLGAIGSSLGMALCADQARADVTGYDAAARAQNEAKRRGAIREGSRDIPGLLHAADLVVLAIPAPAVISFLGEHGPGLRRGVVVTDVAASKVAIMRAADRDIPPGCAFVGGHPLVSVPPGGEHARPDLFRGRPWCLTAAPDAPADALDRVGALVDAVGAVPYFVDPEEHDAWSAGLVGLPPVVAAALVEVAGASPAWRELARAVDTSFDDATAPAVRAAAEGRDLAVTSGAALVSWLDRLLEELVAWREDVADGRADALDRRFAAAAATRERWQQERTRETRQRP